MNEFAFQTAEKVLGNGVVIGIAPAGHALLDTIGFQLLPKVVSIVGPVDKVSSNSPPYVIIKQRREGV